MSAHRAGHLAERRRREAEVAQRVVAVGVEAGRDDQEARVEVAQRAAAPRARRRP